MRCKTKGSSSEKGKQRIYYTAHPKDHSRFLGTIENIIFNVKSCAENCAIYYDFDPEKPEEPESFFENLAAMQLIIIPVTPNLVNDPGCFAYSRVFAFSQEDGHHIPVLPVLMMTDDFEPELDMDYDSEDTVSSVLAKFNDLFSGLQCLSYYIKDETAINSAEKLEKYLNTVIADDSEIETIRSHFDGYIFLSYRKRDRELANELMKKIHSFRCARDIAVWYDEFLTPGEQYEPNIFNALEKSRVFTLLVTPNLLEPAYDAEGNPIVGPDGKYKNNYVIDKEIPKALEMHKRMLLAEMESTDRNSLIEMIKESMNHTVHDNDILKDISFEETFNTFCDPVNNSDFESMLKSRINSIADPGVADDPLHNYYIGLAYLYGVDVEKDTEKAMELFSDASGSLAEAALKMSDIYSRGIGVKRDHAKALEWKEKAVSVCRKKYDETNTANDCIALLKQLSELSGMYAGLCDDAGVLRTSAETSDIAGKLYKGTGNITAFVFGIDALYDEARIYTNTDPQKAYDLYRKAFDLIVSESSMIDEKSSDHYYRTAAKICEGLAESSEKTGRYDDAVSYYDKELEIIKDHIAVTDEKTAEILTAFTEGKKGAVYLGKANISSGKERLAFAEKAENLTEAALQKYTDITSDRINPDITRNTLTLQYRLGDIYYFNDKIDKAFNKYHDAVMLSEKLDRERGLPTDHLSQAEACLRIIRFYSYTGRKTRAVRCIETLYANAREWDMTSLNTMNRYEYAKILIMASEESKEAGYEVYADFFYTIAFEMLESCPDTFPGIERFRLECIQALCVKMTKPGSMPINELKTSSGIRLVKASDLAEDALDLSKEIFMKTRSEHDFRSYADSCFLYEELMRVNDLHAEVYRAYSDLIDVFNVYSSQSALSPWTFRSLALCSFSARMNFLMQGNTELAKNVHENAMYFVSQLKMSPYPELKIFAQAVGNIDYVGNLINNKEYDAAREDLSDYLRILKANKNITVSNIFEENIGKVYYWFYILSVSTGNKMKALYYCEKCRRSRQTFLNYTPTPDAYISYIEILLEAIRLSNETGFFKEAEYMCLKFDNLITQLQRKFGIRLKDEVLEEIGNQLAVSREMMSKAEADLTNLMNSDMIDAFEYCDLNRFVGNYKEAMEQCTKISVRMVAENNYKNAVFMKYMALHCAMVSGKYIQGMRRIGEENVHIVPNLWFLADDLRASGDIPEAEIIIDDGIDLGNQLVKDICDDKSYYNIYKAYFTKHMILCKKSNHSVYEDERCSLRFQALEYLEKAVYWAEEAQELFRDNISVRKMIWNDILEYCKMVMAILSVVSDEESWFYKDIQDEYAKISFDFGMRLSTIL